MQREGTSNVIVEFASGALGYRFGTWGARGSRLRYSFHAHCTAGLIESQFSAGRLLAHRPAGEELLAEDRAAKAITAELAHFLECLRTGARPLTDGPDSLQGLRVI